MIEKLVEPERGTLNEIWQKEWMDTINELIEAVNGQAATITGILKQLDSHIKLITVLTAVVDKLTTNET